MLNLDYFKTAEAMENTKRMAPITTAISSNSSGSNRNL